MLVTSLFGLMLSFFLVFIHTNIVNIQATCTTKTDEIGTCKLLQDCPEIIEIIRQRKKDYNICLPKPLTVCCPEVNTVIQLSAFDFKQSSVGSRKLHEIKCTEYANTVYEYEETKSLLRENRKQSVKTNKCGAKNIPLIVGGDDASAREFPHMALVGYQYKEQKVWKCAGTLISDQYVLTAAHCVQTYLYGTAKYIRLGELDLSKNKLDSDPEDFNIDMIITHPSYDSVSKYNDIALIRLARKVILNEYKRPACLPSSFDGPQKQVIVTGWGKTSWAGDTSDKLQKVVLDKFNRTICNKMYSQVSGELTKGIDDETQICAGSFKEAKDACQGDSGGPMQIFHHSEYCMYTVIGITSFGIRCGTPGIPGVYTRVYPFNDWIEDVVWKNK